MSITAIYTPPSTFLRSPPYYCAASPLSLTCEAKGTNSAFYSWTSNCSGSCFTMGQSTRTVSTHYLESSRAQPNNTYLSVYSGRRSAANYAYKRFDIYCCSNQSSSSNIGSFTEPYGSTYISNFYHLYIERYTYSLTYAGCIRLYGSRSYSYSLSYNPGVYMCNIPDSNGQTQRVNFALFNYNSKFIPYSNKANA